MVEANQSVLDADMGDLDVELHRALLTRIDSQITWHVAPVQMLAHSRTQSADLLANSWHVLQFETSTCGALQQCCQYPC